MVKVRWSWLRGWPYWPYFWKKFFYYYCKCFRNSS